MKIEFVDVGGKKLSVRLSGFNTADLCAIRKVVEGESKALWFRPNGVLGHSNNVNVGARKVVAEWKGGNIS